MNYRRSDYYLNGLAQGWFSGDWGMQLVTVLGALHRAQPSKGYYWEQKYPNTADLRPTAHDYHPAVLKALFESWIDEMVDDLVCDDMVLTHVQVRRSWPGPSYMDWHRDTYIYDGKPVGNFPPAHKLIFYPTLGRAPETKLKFKVGSHLRNHTNQKDDMEALSDLQTDYLMSSDVQYTFFNTALMHGVCEDIDPSGSIRIIYSFLRRRQYEDSLRHIDVHREQVAAYDALRGLR